MQHWEQMSNTYICFNDNGQIKFTGASLENNALTKKNVNANNVRGKITGKKIQCTFDATVDSSTARAVRAPDTALGVVSGTYNSSSGSLGAPTTLIKTDLINLSNPNQTVTNNAATATTASPNVTMTTTNTTNNAMSFRQTLIQALVISAGVMGLSML
ncbi:unnamed protein product [Tetraodon nigroviridis]|uniref:(spotted green pufferfish) hypothetical protein n=1 Tax=Tetraodon nigroviridis TaxID=99883 RepID=Q4SQR6_TETNG|nr:unnamed protein product [Tetraodon nigroviridis]